MILSTFDCQRVYHYFAPCVSSRLADRAANSLWDVHQLLVDDRKFMLASLATHMLMV